jgi:hypothetical protein
MPKLNTIGHAASFNKKKGSPHGDFHEVPNPFILAGILPMGYNARYFAGRPGWLLPTNPPKP